MWHICQGSFPGILFFLGGRLFQCFDCIDGCVSVLLINSHETVYPYKINFDFLKKKTYVFILFDTGSCYVAQAGLKFANNLPASAPQVLGL